jgi:hypothetical protein
LKSVKPNRRTRMKRGKKVLGFMVNFLVCVVQVAYREKGAFDTIKSDSLGGLEVIVLGENKERRRGGEGENGRCPRFQSRVAILWGADSGVFMSSF